MKSLEENAATAKEKINEQQRNIKEFVLKKLDEGAKEMKNKVDTMYANLYTELSKQRDEINDYVVKVQGNDTFSSSEDARWRLFVISVILNIRQSKGIQ